MAPLEGHSEDYHSRRPEGHSICPYLILLPENKGKKKNTVLGTNTGLRVRKRKDYLPQHKFLSLQTPASNKQNPPVSQEQNTVKVHPFSLS